MTLQGSGATHDYQPREHSRDMHDLSYLGIVYKKRNCYGARPGQNRTDRSRIYFHGAYDQANTLVLSFVRLVQSVGGIFVIKANLSDSLLRQILREIQCASARKSICESIMRQLRTLFSFH